MKLLGMKREPAPPPCNIEPSRRIDMPEPGMFRRRLVKGGPEVPCEITLQDGLWQALICGKPVGEAAADPVDAPGVFDLWTSGVRISESEYRYLLELSAWAKTRQPDHPAANPGKAISLKSLGPIYQKGKDQ